MRRLHLSALTVVAALGLAATPALAAASPAAHHQHPVAKTTPSGIARLYVRDAFTVRRQIIDVPGRSILLQGWVGAFAPDQRVTLTVALGGHQRRISLRLRPNSARTRGHFATTVTASHAGTLTLRVSHRAAPALGAFSVTRSIQIVPESTGDGLYTQLVQQRLAALHLYMPQSGQWDLQTQLAIEAYHRLLQRGTSATLDPATLTDLLDGRGAFPVRFPHQGRHVEGDLSLQLAALIDNSQVDAIYPISSGKPSTPTILGSYQIYNRVAGYLPDGMYYSDFFIRGYALHGYDPSPDYPASHGCMRLPISDAISAFDWLALGDWVDVYGVPNESV